MPIDPHSIEEIIADIAKHIRAADPATMFITYGRTVKPVEGPQDDVDGYVIADKLTITIELNTKKS